MKFNIFISLMNEEANANLKKEQIDGYDWHSHKILWVDGNYIRKEYDEEFTDFGDNLQYEFIPEDEMWIDKGNGSVDIDEVKLFVDHMTNRKNLVESGGDFDDAEIKAELLEKKERKKLSHLKEHHDTKQAPIPSKETLEKIRKKEYYKLNGTTVWLIDGKIVRDTCFNDFVEGGHGYVYGFVPKGEIWIEETMKEEEIPYILVHEYFEMLKMKNDKMPYEKAHYMASSMEHKCRVNEFNCDMVLRTLQSIEGTTVQ